MQFIKDLAESGADFADQFDRDSATFHGGITEPVPLGGARVPESMKNAEGDDWRDLPEAPMQIEDDYGSEFNLLMEAHTRLNSCKKAISVVNKPVEMVMKLRVQYRGAIDEDKVAMESRMKGAENDRDGALSAATCTIFEMDKRFISQRTRACVKDVSDQGRFTFEDQSHFGEYMQVLQRANQAIFMDQKKMLEQIKAIKKAKKGEENTNKAADAMEVEIEEGVTAAAGA
mmetsp:Transcript_47862/g.77636  ORF Transcript_47862/g.77636 Transcript_47862/m.77636 type:complete len:230 (-) Transcript_47862:246-935(-)